ncbi:FAD-dependent oxidoreductase [Arthrobacter sp. SA17]
MLPVPHLDFLVEGHLRVEVEGGDSYDLTAGCAASFNKGARTRWEVLASTVEFLCIPRWRPWTTNSTTLWWSGPASRGLTAARELSRQGLSVRIVEARERIGGRTWLDRRLGRDLEIGGTWVHWTQPYVWAELKRYGLDTTPSPEPEEAFWWADGRRHEGGPEELLGLIGGMNGEFVKYSREYFPEPFRPLSRNNFKAIDHVSVQHRIRQQFPAGAQRDILESFWTLNFNGPLENGALTQALRWVALTNGDWAVNFEACATYKIVGGTAAGLQARTSPTAGVVSSMAQSRAAWKPPSQLLLRSGTTTDRSTTRRSPRPLPCWISRYLPLRVAPFPQHS